jgi:hypothetical protein
LDATKAMTRDELEPWVSERRWLNFAQVAMEQFNFLRDYGFTVYESTPTIVRFRKEEFEVNIYHGRRSYEIGMEICREDRCYSIEALVRLTDRESADRFRYYAATTPEGVLEGVKQLASIVRQYGDQALRGDSPTFGALAAQRAAMGKALAEETLAHQIRPKAEAAFRNRSYREAADLYEKILPSLTPTELKKLAFAKDRASR